MASFPDALGRREPPLDPTGSDSPDLNQQFLQLRIGSDTPVLLPVQQLTEVLTVPENQIMPIPHMPPWAMGVYNWRGEVLWMIDLGHLCGLAPWYQQPLSRSVHSVVVLSLIDASAHSTLAKDQILGLVVQQIEEMEQVALNAVQSMPLGAFPPQLKPFSAGYWWRNEESLAILNGNAILKRVSQQLA